MSSPLPGHIFLTRNTEETGNRTPGYWNHAAMMSINGWVVEAQEKPNAVIAVPYPMFLQRYPEVVCIDVVGQQRALNSMAHHVIDWLGVEYDKIESFLPRFGDGENCVSVVRKCYRDVMNRDPRWKLPSAIFRRRWVKEVIFRKIEYDTWVSPEIWFEGMTTEKSALKMPALIYGRMNSAQEMLNGLD